MKKTSTGIYRLEDKNIDETMEEEVLSDKEIKQNVTSPSEWILSPKFPQIKYKERKYGSQAFGIILQQIR